MPHDPNTLSEYWRMVYEERAAIREFDAHMTRDEAEDEAWTDTMAAMAREQSKEPK